MSQDESQTRFRHRGSRQSVISGGTVKTLDENLNDVILEIDDSKSNYDDEEDNDSKKKKQVSGAFTLISVVVLVTLTLLFVKYMDQRLPNPLTIADVGDNPKAYVNSSLYLLKHRVALNFEFYSHNVSSHEF